MSRNNGKRAAAIGRASDSDVPSDEEPEYNVDWLPEARSVFVVPFTEFYNSFAECPKGTCTPRNWRQQHREGVLVGTKRHNNAKVGLTHGIQFEGDARPSYYIQIYEWEEYCLGPSLSDADDGSEHSDSDVTPAEGGSESDSVDPDSDSPAFDPNAVVAEYDEDELEDDEEEDDSSSSEPAMDENTPLDKRLEALAWKEDGVIRNDQRILDHRPENFTPLARLQNQDTCNLIQWWFKWFPKSLLLDIVNQINIKANSIKWPSTRNWKVLKNGEFLRWMGMWLLMGVYPTSPRRAYWRGQLHFGKYMTESRFEQIQRAFCLPFYKKSNPKWGGAAGKKMKYDRFLHCRCYLDQLKVAWIKAMEPGGWLCLDESMVAWLGLALLMPGWKVIKRKPHPFGLEFKTVCCGTTGIMINFEPQEGKDVMVHHPFVKEVNKSSAWCLRLCQPWFNSWRTLVADAAFGQVRMVVSMLEKGVYTLCNVKQCHKFFPKKYLKDNTPAFTGNSVCTTLALQAKVKLQCGREMSIQACGWRATTTMVVTYLGSCGLTTPGDARQKKRYQLLQSGKTKTINYTVQRPSMGSEYQAHMGEVDTWNYLRHQFKLPPTNDPMFRIFCDFSIVGTSINVYKALAYFCPERLVDPKSTSAEKADGKGKMTHHQFAEIMAMHLIQNQWIMEEGASEDQLHQQAGQEARVHQPHPNGIQHRRKCIGCNTITHLVTRERTIQCQGKAHKLRPGWRFFCKRCWPEHVCGEAKHSRASSKRPGVSASNRTRAEEGAGSDSD